MGTLKLNSDIAVTPACRLGLGFVIRNHQGDVMLAGKSKQQAAGSTTLKEGLAIRYGLQMARQYHIHVNQLECDNKEVVDCINGVTKPGAYCDIVVMDIRKLMQETGCRTAKHIPRTANHLAHCIAHGPEFRSIRHNPSHVNSLIHLDVID